MSTSYFMLKFLKRKREITCKNDLNNDEKKETTGFINKCRICLKNGSIPIFNQDETFNISEAVRIYGGIELNEYDEYPKFLCTACHTFLQKATVFKKTAQETNKHLRETLVQNVSTDMNDCITDNYENSNEIAKLYNCKICKLNFKSSDEYILHNNLKHHKNVRIRCPICYGLLTAQLFKRHLERHQSASHLICDVCGKLYRKDNLIRHLQLHNYKLPFHCQVCPYRGRFMESLKIHMRTHTGDRPFSCDKCDLNFLTRSNLNRHLLTHKKNKPFKCTECNRGFYTKHDMDVHFKGDHIAVRDFCCTLCGNKYGTRKALMRHELRVHKRDKMAKGRVPLYLQAEYQNEVLKLSY